jgi:hypothetical protein
MMRKLFFIAIAALFLAGCGATVRESGYYGHSTHYKDCEHMKFSICGYPNADKKVAQESKAENWWGLEVKVPENK